jgi:hypothetical protein
MTISNTARFDIRESPFRTRQLLPILRACKSGMFVPGRYLPPNFRRSGGPETQAHLCPASTSRSSILFLTRYPQAVYSPVPLHSRH